MILFNSSALPRVMVCAGSAGLVSQAPKADKTDDAKEGTAFHHFAAELLQGRQIAEGDKAPNGFLCDGEMLEHATNYANTLRADPSWTARVEAPMHWGPGGVANDSQAWQVRVKVDTVTWRSDIETLAVIDAKYGFRYVDVEDNWQLLSQAIGACFSLRIQPKRIILGVYQPRIGGEALRTIEITPEELLEAYAEIFATLDSIVSGANAELVTSEHCRRCDAMAGCPAAQRASFNAVDVALAGGAYYVNDAGIATELDVLTRAEQFIKQRKSALENHALHEMRNGKPIPGLYTKAQLGHTKWRDNVDVMVLRMKGNHFVDEVPCSPAEAKRRGMSQEDYDAMTHRPNIGVKLLRGNGAAEAAKVFGDQKPKRSRKKKT